MPFWPNWYSSIQKYHSTRVSNKLTSSRREDYVISTSQIPWFHIFLHYHIINIFIDWSHGYSCHPHKCLSCGKTCYGEMKTNTPQSYMEMVNMLTISFFLINYIYHYSLSYIYLIIWYFHFLCPNITLGSRGDAIVSVFATNVVIATTCSIGVPHSLV